MSTNPDHQAGISRNQELNVTSDGEIPKASTNSTWIRSRDSRIVRVSRAFGGKDRHSKVCTLKGLRDRRVRLSVPTAIQLYDLQEKLGLNQPSKVVDWLLNAAKDEIDELPPLPVSPEDFVQNYQSMLSTSSHHQAASSSLQQDCTLKGDEHSTNDVKAKSKEVMERAINNEEGNKEEEIVLDESNSSNSFLKKGLYHPSFQGLMNNAMSYGSNNFPHWEPSSTVSLSHLGSHGFTSQAEDVPSPLSLSTGTQFLVYPTGSTQICIPSHVAMTSMELDHRQINQIQMLGTGSSHNYVLSSNPLLNPSLFPKSQAMRPLHFVVSPKDIEYDQDNGTSQANANQGFHSN